MRDFLSIGRSQALIKMFQTSFLGNAIGHGMPPPDSSAAVELLRNRAETPREGRRRYFSAAQARWMRVQASRRASVEVA